MPRGLRVAVLAALFAAACGDEQGNPFDTFSPSQPPGDDAVLLFASGSWTTEPGQPRELFAVDADGSAVERLTTCTQTAQPCNTLLVAPSTIRARVAAVRSTPEAEPGAAALYFVDLERSVETVIAEQGRVNGVDWSLDGGFILYSAGGDFGTDDLYSVQPNGENQQPLTQTLQVSERGPRINPFGSSAAYEHHDESAAGAIGVLLSNLSTVLLTSGGDVSRPLAGTPYFVGSDADPCFSPDGQFVAFRRLTDTGNGGLGSWDILSVDSAGAEPVAIAAGESVFRGAPDWGPGGIVFVETDAEASESRLVVVQQDGSGRTVLRVEDSAYGMTSPRWLR